MGMKLPDPPAGAELEGTAKTVNRGGRPQNKPPLESVLRVIKSIEEQAVESRGDLDWALAHKMLALYMAITYERGFLARDSEMPLKARCELVARSAPVMTMFEGMIPKEGTRFPKTADAIDAETQARHIRMAKLMDKGVDPGLEAVIATYAPAAAAPPEEA